MLSILYMRKLLRARLLDTQKTVVLKRLDFIIYFFFLYIISKHIDGDVAHVRIGNALYMHLSYISYAREHYGHRIPSLVKYASGRIRASYPKLWPRNIISPRIVPI